MLLETHGDLIKAETLLRVSTPDPRHTAPASDNGCSQSALRCLFGPNSTDSGLTSLFSCFQLLGPGAKDLRLRASAATSGKWDNSSPYCGKWGED